MFGRLPAQRVLFDGPTRYRIQVLGRIPASWSERLEGMSVRSNTTVEGRTICELEGELLDQAALLGVFNTIYELHLPVLLVRCLSYPADTNEE